MKIIDCCELFSVDVCSCCGNVRPTTTAFVSRVYKNAADAVLMCKPCIRDIAHPKDFEVWRKIWELEKKEQKRTKALVELQALVERNPGKRFYPILQQLTEMRHPHEHVLEAIHRMYLGKQPTRTQWKPIIKLIRSLRNARAGIDTNSERRTYLLDGRGSLHSGTGACGLW